MPFCSFKRRPIITEFMILQHGGKGEPVIDRCHVRHGWSIQWLRESGVRFLCSQFVFGSVVRLLSHSAGSDRVHLTLSLSI